MIVFTVAIWHLLYFVITEKIVIDTHSQFDIWVELFLLFGAQSLSSFRVYHIWLFILLYILLCLSLRFIIHIRLDSFIALGHLSFQIDHIINLRTSHIVWSRNQTSQTVKSLSGWLLWWVCTSSQGRLVWTVKIVKIVSFS